MGRVSTVMSAASAVPGSIETSSLRRLTLRSVMWRADGRVLPSATPSPTEGGVGDELGRGGGGRVDGPHGRAAAAARRRDERLLEPPRVEVGSRLREQRSRSGREGRRRARAAQGSVAGRTVLVAPGIGRREADPGGTHLRLRAAVEREALGGERRRLAALGVLVEGSRADGQRRRGRASRSARRTVSASPEESPRIGTSAGPSVPSAPAGSGPSTRTARAPAATTSRTASGEDVPRGRSTAAPPTRL